MDIFEFNSYWEAIDTDFKNVLNEITNQLDHNKRKLCQDSNWGGRVFWAFISNFEKSSIEKSDFERGVEQFLSCKYSTLEAVHKQGIKPINAKIAFCYSAHIHEQAFGVSFPQFLLKFYGYAKDRQTHLEFEECKKTLGLITPFIPSAGVTPVKTAGEALKLKRPPMLNNDYYFGNRLIETPTGREVEQKCLWQFLTCDKPFVWFQLAGVAGQGKSRLAYELILKAEKNNWNAGFLHKKEIERMRGKWEEWHPDKPHLIVVDYVIKNVNEISSVFQSLVEQQDTFVNNNVRLLLLERQRWDHAITFNSEEFEVNDLCISLGVAERYAPWFLDLIERNDGIADQIQKSAYRQNIEKLCEINQGVLIKEEDFGAGVLELKGLASDKLIDIVKKTVFNKRELILSSSETEEIKEQLHKIDKDGRPLYAYFLALQIVDGVRTYGWTRTDLLKNTLAREHEKWWAGAFSTGKKYRLYGDDPALQLVMLATMAAGVDCFSAGKICDALDISEKAREQALALVGHPVAKTNEVPQIIPPLQPSLLGEWLVIQYLNDQRVLKKLNAIAWLYSPDDMSAFIQRLVQDFPDEKIVDAILNNLDIEIISIENLSKFAKSLFLHFCKLKRNVDEKIIDSLKLISKEDEEASLYVGVHYLSLSDFETAAQTFRAIISKNPQAYDAYNNLGVALANLGQSQEAVKAFRSAIDINIQCAEAQCNLGAWLAIQGNHLEAIKAYRCTINLNPRIFQAHNNLGASLKELGLFQESIEACRDAIRINPNVASVYFNLGTSLVGSEQYEDAIEAYQNVIYLNSQDAEASLNLHWVVARLSVNSLLAEQFSPNPEDEDWAKNQIHNILTDNQGELTLNVKGWSFVSGERAVKILRYLRRNLRLTCQFVNFKNHVCRRVRRVALEFYTDCYLVDIELYSAESENSVNFNLIVNNVGGVVLNKKIPTIHWMNEEFLSFASAEAIYTYLQFYSHFIDIEIEPLHLLTELKEFDWFIDKGALPVSVRNSFFPVQYLRGKFEIEGWQRYQGCMLFGDALYTVVLKLLYNGDVELEDEQCIAENLPILREL